MLTTECLLWPTSGRQSWLRKTTSKSLSGYMSSECRQSAKENLLVMAMRALNQFQVRLPKEEQYRGEARSFRLSTKAKHSLEELLLGEDKDCCPQSSLKCLSIFSNFLACVPS